MKKLKYGIMSTSSISPRFISAVREAGAGDVIAISSRTLEKAKQKADEWEIERAYGSHTELLEDNEINIVYISSVNSEHYSMAKLALEKGKHVICEKPCTTSSEHTKELFETARKKGLFFMEAQKMLFLPVILETAKLIESGKIGEIQMVEFNHSFSAGYNNWLFDNSLGGGTLLSSGVYAIQLILWLFGDIKSIYGACSKNKGFAEHQYILSGETHGGILFSIKNSTCAVLDNSAKIYGSRGKIEISEYWKARKAVIYSGDTEPETIDVPCKYELIYEAKHIYECMEKGLLTSPVVTEDITVKAIEIIENIKNDWDRQ